MKVEATMGPVVVLLDGQDWFWALDVAGARRLHGPFDKRDDAVADALRCN